MKKNQGFTLIELMITVVVIGILASIAIPNYFEYMTRARRSDATKGLDYLAACQERYFWQTKTYSTDMALLGDCGSTTSPDGFYTLAITAADVNGYTLTAAPTAGPQLNDTPCLVITRTSAGQRTPTACW